MTKTQLDFTCIKTHGVRVGVKKKKRAKKGATVAACVGVGRIERAYSNKFHATLLVSACF